MVQIPSDPETQRFVRAVQSKVAQVSVAYERKGRSLVSCATPAVRRAIAMVAALQKRWQAGDYTHSRQEEEALKTLSKWLVEAWHRLHGTEVPPTSWIRDD